MYRVVLRQEGEYILRATSKGEARLEALQRFKSAQPLIVSTEELSPCQIDGVCPFSGNCSDCRKRVE